MQSMDRNKDGTIQFYEFAKTIGSRFYKQHSKNDIIAAFKQYDKDKNGSISASELYEVMKKFRGDITKKEVQDLVKKIDKDGNGSINIAG